MKVVFIAGPLTTGGDGSLEYIRKNIEIAERYNLVLAKNEIGFFCAHTHTGFHGEREIRGPDEFYYVLDFEILMRAADAVLAIPGWEKSKGAKKEVEWAQQNGLPVFFPKSPDDMDEIIEWSKSSP